MSLFMCRMRSCRLSLAAVWGPTWTGGRVAACLCLHSSALKWDMLAVTAGLCGEGGDRHPLAGPRCFSGTACVAIRAQRGAVAEKGPLPALAVRPWRWPPAPWPLARGAVPLCLVCIMGGVRAPASGLSKEFSGYCAQGSENSAGRRGGSATEGRPSFPAPPPPGAASLSSAKPSRRPCAKGPWPVSDLAALRSGDLHSMIIFSARLYFSAPHLIMSF